MGENNCELFGAFGLGVQVSLGIISFTILIIKRQLEWPKRSWRIWSLDCSKQIISALLIHFINVFFAVVLSNKSNDTSDNACIWYLVNILLDSSIGVVLNWILVRLLEVFARHYEIDTLISGCYFERNTYEFGDYTINYWIWTIQTFVWCIISSLMKVIIYAIMVAFDEKLERIGSYLLSGIDDYPKVELVVVMVFVPFTLNCFQVIYYYLVLDYR